MRTFIAIELCEGIRSDLARLQGKLRTFDRAVRWVRTAQMHLTLKFLGEVEDNRIPGVITAVDQAVSNCSPFDLTVAGTGCFPNGGAPRVVWAGVDDPGGQLATCHEALERELDRLGFERDGRRFSPHLTLGRVKMAGAARGLRESLAALSDFDAGSQSVVELVVFASELRRGGAVHTPMHRAGLGR